jgi:murein peptide amidase A
MSGSRLLASLAAALVLGTASWVAVGAARFSQAPSPGPLARAAALGGGPVDRDVLGHSALGRPIAVYRFGDADAPRRLLVVGCIHGDECAGMKVTDLLLRAGPPVNTEVWVVQNLNPDGRARGTRQNGRGVDLNRNFGAMWKPIGRRWDAQYAGPRPWSEPETRLARALILRIRPTATVWFHQPQTVVRAWGPSRTAARRYARLAGMGYRSLAWPNGTAPNWQNHRFPGTASFVVELPAGRLGLPATRRHARAVRQLVGRF